MRYALILAILLSAGVGCSDTLETGYAPRKLGVSEAVRRGYYAQPYTAEAQAANAEREPDDAFKGARPQGAYGAQ